MKLVILESPYAGNVARNIAYARLCMLDCLQHDEAPIASHLLYTQILDDNIPEQRLLGIDAGLSWRKVADGTVVYNDFGESQGMKYGVKLMLDSFKPVEYRRLGAKVVAQLINDYPDVEPIERKGL